MRQTYSSNVSCSLRIAAPSNQANAPTPETACAVDGRGDRALGGRVEGHTDVLLIPGQTVDCGRFNHKDTEVGDICVHDNAPDQGQLVATNWVNENLITLSAAAKRLPQRRRGKRPHASTLFRWTTRGLRGVVLESTQVGGTRCTSLEALQRFFNRLKSLNDASERLALPYRCSERRSDAMRRQVGIAKRRQTGLQAWKMVERCYTGRMRKSLEELVGVTGLFIELGTFGTWMFGLLEHPIYLVSFFGLGIGMVGASAFAIMRAKHPSRLLDVGGNNLGAERPAFSVRARYVAMIVFACSIVGLATVAVFETVLAARVVDPPEVDIRAKDKFFARPSFKLIDYSFVSTPDQVNTQSPRDNGIALHFTLHKLPNVKWAQITTVEAVVHSYEPLPKGVKPPVAYPTILQPQILVVPLSPHPGRYGVQYIYEPVPGAGQDLIMQGKPTNVGQSIESLRSHPIEMNEDTPQPFVVVLTSTTSGVYDVSVILRAVSGMRTQTVELCRHKVRAFATEKDVIEWIEGWSGISESDEKAIIASGGEEYRQHLMDRMPARNDVVPMPPSP